MQRQYPMLQIRFTPLVVNPRQGWTRVSDGFGFQCAKLHANVMTKRRQRHSGIDFHGRRLRKFEDGCPRWNQVAPYSWNLSYAVAGREDIDRVSG